MTLTQPRMTDEELMRLPKDGYQYEYVDGEVIRMHNHFLHDLIITYLVRFLYPPTKGRGYLVVSNAGFRMKSGNIRCPDLSFMRKERMPGGKPFQGFGEGAPDLCIEVISPSEARGAMRRKLEEYFESGACEVWHLYPETREVERFTSPTDVTVFGPGETLDGGDLLPGFQSLVSALFDVEE